MKTALPPFVQRFPWWGGDLQTLASALIDAPSSLAPATSERLSIKLADGDTMLAMLDRPPPPHANKPLVLMHPGRSGRAQASALSHTGSLTGDHAVMRTLVTRESVVMVETLEELVDVAEILLRFPVPPAKGNAIVTNS